MRRKRLIIGFLLALPAPGPQATDSTTQDLIQKLLARIDGLEKRIAELEQQGAAKGVVATALPALKPATEAVHATHDEIPQIEGAQPVYPSLKIAGFTDFNFSA